jgi:hypothetical protein
MQYSKPLPHPVLQLPQDATRANKSIKDRSSPRRNLVRMTRAHAAPARNTNNATVDCRPPEFKI